MESCNLKLMLNSVSQVGFEMEQGDFDLNQIRYSFYTKTLVSIATSSIKVVGGVMCKSDEKQLLKLEMELTFTIEALDSVVEVGESGKNINFKIDPMPTLLTATIGVMRGVLFEKTEGSGVRNTPFPLIAMDLLMKNNTIFLVD